MTTEAQVWAEAGTSQLPDALPRPPEHWREHLSALQWLNILAGWGGTYEAVCPHGRITTWNAYRIEPECTCLEMET